MEKISVLQVNKLYYPEVGGIEKTLQQISEGLNSRVELEVLVCQKRGIGCVERVNGVKIHRSGSLGVISSVPISLSFIFNLRKLSKGKDIIHMHMPFPLGDLAYLLSGHRGKCVVYWHSDVVKQKKWIRLYKPIMKRFLNKVDVIMVGAEGIINGSHYLQPYFVKCQVVPFAVSDEILNSGKKYLTIHGYKSRKKNINFLFIGRLVYYKGCSVLIEAFSRMNLEASLTIIGDGYLRHQLERRALETGDDDKVTFMGRVNNSILKKCMESADVFVLPSIERSEAFGLVQLEAMAYGLPVINTKLLSGVPEVSIHGETGLTVEPNNIEELKKAMEWMVINVDERYQMGVNARKRVEKNYTQENMINNINKVYCDILRK